jgi:hypothetical protein
MNINKNVGWKTVIVVLIIASALFYWFIIRPAQIRFSCHQQTGGYGPMYETCIAQHNVSTDGLAKDYK